MNPGFYLVAALMLAAALACVAVPLLRAGRRAGRARTPFVLAMALILVVPAAAIGLYAWFGTPAALQPRVQNDATDLAGMTAELRARLQRSPGHPEGWLLLGQAYTAMDRPADARDAFGHALELKPGDPDIMAAYAEADAQARPDHRIQGQSRALLQRAVALQPDHQRALWLLGISDYQNDDFNGAIAHWQQLSKLLPPGSKLATAVDAQVAMAQARAQGRPQAQAGAIAQAMAAPASAPAAGANAGADATGANAVAARAPAVALKVRVELDPGLAGKVSAGDTLFVFARAAGGPPMPLAVARLPASRLPATVTLTDAMAMTPQLKLSMFPRVRVAARISKSGDALPHAGDLESRPMQVDTGSNQPVALTIDRVH